MFNTFHGLPYRKPGDCFLGVFNETLLEKQRAVYAEGVSKIWVFCKGQLAEPRFISSRTVSQLKQTRSFMVAKIRLASGPKPGRLVRQHSSLPCIDWLCQAILSSFPLILQTAKADRVYETKTFNPTILPVFHFMLPFQINQYVNIWQSANLIIILAGMEAGKEGEKLEECKRQGDQNVWSFPGN